MKRIPRSMDQRTSVEDAGTRNDTESKDEVARRLIDWHFRVEPGMEQIFRIVTPNEGDPNEPIKLLEVSKDTFDTGRVDTLTFAASGDITFPTRVAIITPEEYKRVERGVMPLPIDWDITKAQRFQRPEAKRVKRKK